MKIPGKILDFLYPPDAVCVGCGDPSGAEHDGLCEDCLNQLEKIRTANDETRCPHCMSLLYRGECAVCGLMGKDIRNAAFAFRYDPPASGIVKRFKYYGMGYLCEWMAQQMLQAPHAHALLEGADVIVCAPADRVRKTRRGYNQAQLLARAIARRTGLSMMDPLRRRPFVRPQARLKREARLKNLTDVISCPQQMTGKHVLLIDDVRTTGATAAACARALLNAGAASVDLLTFAAPEGR